MTPGAVCSSGTRPRSWALEQTLAFITVRPLANPCGDQVEQPVVGPRGWLRREPRIAVWSTSPPRRAPPTETADQRALPPQHPTPHQVGTTTSTPMDVEVAFCRLFCAASPRHWRIASTASHRTSSAARSRGGCPVMGPLLRAAPPSLEDHLAALLCPPPVRGRPRGSAWRSPPSGCAPTNEHAVLPLVAQVEQQLVHAA